MAITFFCQSRKQIAPIWVRYRELSVDAKARTSLYIDKDRLKSSKVVKHKMTAKDNAEQKLLIKEKNKALDRVQGELMLLEVRIRSLVTQNTQVDSAWLKQALRPAEEVVKLSLLDYYQSLLDSNVSIAKNTRKAYITNARFMLRYQESIGRVLYVSDIDARFKDSFMKYCRDNGYPESTLKGQLQRLKAVCLYAESRGEAIHNQVKNLSKGIKKQPSQNVFLTPSEIGDIIALELEDKVLETARDWLVISCFIGQRSVSLLKLTKDNIDTKTNTIRLTQVKTKASVVIPILPQVEAILKRYKGGFPPQLSKSTAHNYSLYNTAIKEVCKLAGINEMVKGRVTSVGDRKSEIVVKEKWELVTSHIGRRSFCTMYYTKINLQVLMSISGHQTETNFLKYINANRVVDTDALHSAFSNAIE